MLGVGRDVGRGGGWKIARLRGIARRAIVLIVAGATIRVGTTVGVPWSRC